MEIILTVSGLALTLVIIALVSYLWAYVWEPKIKRPKIIAALEENERLGLSDIDSNPKRAAERWSLIRMGQKEPKRMHTEGILDRLSAQMAVFAPRESDLRRIRNSVITSLDIPL